MALESDVVVLDIGMPLLNGIEATAQITRKVPSVAVSILSMHADEALPRRPCGRWPNRSIAEYL